MVGAITRRTLLAGGAVAVAGGGALAVDAWRGRRAYEAAQAGMRAPLPDLPTLEDLVRYATLAANGHNTQPWRFRRDGSAVALVPDFSRRTPVADPDDHHLWASLGAAAETLRISARARGLGGELGFDGAEGGRVTVSLAPGAAEEGPRFAAISERQSTRSLYDGSGLAPETADQLVAAAREAGAEALWIEDPGRREALLGLIVAANTRQCSDPAFIAELRRWLRFNPGTAARSGDGLYAAASGNPVLPSWLGGIAFDLAFSADAENAKYVAQARSSSGLAVIVAPADAPPGWVAAGRAAQALMLEATVLGLRCAFLNQAVEIAETRAELQSLLGLGAARPSLVLRVGRGPAMPRSVRRPVAEVLEG